MKLIIDIPKDLYESACKSTYTSLDELDAIYAIKEGKRFITCKNCVKRNRRIGDYEETNNGVHWFWKDEACPLAEYRGKAQGHEFDYQFCSFAEPKSSKRSNRSGRREE